jgi:hypothetical protein
MRESVDRPTRAGVLAAGARLESGVGRDNRDGTTETEQRRRNNGPQVERLAGGHPAPPNPPGLEALNPFDVVS